MSWFKKKDKPLIPPVEEKKDDFGRRPAYGREDSTASSRSYGDSFTSNSQSRPPYGDRMPTGGDGDAGGYGRYGGSRGDDNSFAEARNNLFAGAKKVEPGGPARSRFAGFNSGQDLEDDDDVEAIKTKTKSVNSDTLQISRDALRTVKDTTIIAEETRRKLIDQTEALAGMERSLDVSKGYSSRAEDHVHDINQFNKSIFNPAVTWNKTKKREAQEEKLRLRHEEELADRERNRLLLRDAARRAGEMDGYGDRGDDGQDGEGLRGGGGYGYSRQNLTQAQLAQRKAERKRYQVGDAGASDDELEDELENNLDEIAEMTKRLRGIATSQGEELRSQMPLIERLEDKTVNEEARISRNTRRLDRIK